MCDALFFEIFFPLEAEQAVIPPPLPSPRESQNISFVQMWGGGAIFLFKTSPLFPSKKKNSKKDLTENQLFNNYRRRHLRR